VTQAIKIAKVFYKKTLAKVKLKFCVTKERIYFQTSWTKYILKKMVQAIKKSKIMTKN
jgi:hypothetical protein